MLPLCNRWLVEGTAGPSTSLRSGRDDNSHLGTGCVCPRKIVISKKVISSERSRVRDLGFCLRPKRAPGRRTEVSATQDRIKKLQNCSEKGWNG
jgi:hypothetical protein